MAVPKQRHTKGRRNNRRMHLHTKGVVLGVCPKCGKKIRQHSLCQHCGYYKGMEVIDVLKKLTKKEKKARKKEMDNKEKEEKAKPLDMGDLSKK